MFPNISLGFITNNVRGIQSYKKRLKLIQYSKEKIGSTRVLFLQETHSSSKVEQKWKEDFNPANICWSWRRLQHVFSVTIIRLPRRLEKVLKTSCKTKNCYTEKVLKTSWRHILKTFWRHYEQKQNTYWRYLDLTNLNVYLTNLYFTNLYLTILRRIQNALIRTH